MLTRDEWLVAISAPDSTAAVRELIGIGHPTARFAFPAYPRQFSMLPLLQLACTEQCPLTFNLSGTRLLSRYRACLPPQLETVRTLLDARADVRETDAGDIQSALVCAVASYHVPLIELLLSRSVGGGEPIQCYVSRLGHTVMHEWAVASPVLHKDEQDYEAVLDCLAALHPPPPFEHADHRGVTPLLMASKCRARGVITYYRMLEMRGMAVDLDYMDHAHRAALHSIVDLSPEQTPPRDPTETTEDRVEAMVFLLEHGADAFVGGSDESMMLSTPAKIIENNKGCGADALREAFAAFQRRKRPRH